MRKARVVAALAMVLLVGAVVLALGSSSSPTGPGRKRPSSQPTMSDAAGLLQSARAAVEDATSLHIVGRDEEDDDTVNVDIRSLPREHKCAGTVTGDGLSMEFIISNGSAYLRGNRAFWRLALDASGTKPRPGEVDAVIRYLHGRWAEGDLPAKVRTLFDRFCEVKRLVTPLQADAEVSFSGRQIVGDRTGRRVRFDYQGNHAVVAVDVAAPHDPMSYELVDDSSGYVISDYTLALHDDVRIVVPRPEDTVSETGPVFGA